MTPAALSFRRARQEDADVIAALVNSGYRGEASKQGWTTEADLLEGIRTDAAEVRQLIELHDSMIYLCLQGEEIVGSVHLQLAKGVGYLGLFVVKPGLQGAGIGKQFMLAAERAAQTAWGIRKMTMTVITVRAELIAFYERRGYRRTGTLIPFPADEQHVPKVAGLQMEYLEKELLTS
jgi:ribosomal protein S18 acetylase RimI-like enzyme